MDEILDRPIFVGGTGRSGTTVAGRLLNVHPQLTLTRPRELRFIASALGAAEAYWTVTEGRIPRIKRTPPRNPLKRAYRVAFPYPQKPSRVAPELVVQSLWTHWFERDKPSGAVNGLSLALSRDSLEVAAAAYLADFGADPYVATRRLVATVIAPQMDQRGDLRWVDTTPANARAADRMIALFPDAKIVHMMRDGRDVAASFAGKKFGPNNVMVGLEAWRMRMLDAHRAELAVPAGTVIRIDLQRLVVTHRKATLARLLSGIDVPSNPTFRQWFAENISAKEAKPGRWRKDFSVDDCARIDNKYGEILEELKAVGAPCPVRADDSMRLLRIKRRKETLRRPAAPAKPSSPASASPADEH